MEVKYCEDTRPENQLEAVKQQHREFCQLLLNHGATASITLHTILLLGGITYRPHTFEPLHKLGLDPHKAIKLAWKLHAQSIQYAFLANGALEKSTDTTHDT